MNTRQHKILGGLLTLVAVSFVGVALGALNPSAQTFYWTGAADASWTNASNWEMEDGSAAATAPGVVGDLSKPEEWGGNKRDTAIFDGARFKSLSALTLNVQGLLCVGYVTVRGATTPEISFGTSRGDAQCFPLYSSAVEPTDANGEPGVFTVAADVVNMPVIPYPGIGALFDNASSSSAFGKFVNNVKGRTFTLLSTRKAILDPSIASKNITVHAAFAGPGDFSLGGTYAGKASCGVGASGQKFFDYYPSEGSSLVVTNCTETFARVYFKTSETCLHTVTIAKDSWLKANNIGFDQLVFCGSFHFVGEGWLGAQGSTKTSPFGLPLAGSTNRFDVPIYVGREYKYDRPSTDEVRFVMNKNGASALELNNPQNVFDGGIYVDGGDLTVGALDNETGSAIGDGKLTFLGRHVFKYTGDAAVMTNAIFAGQGGGQGGNETGIEFVHAGHGKLEVHGKIDFPSVNQQNRVLVRVPNADAELEFFQGIQDATTYTGNGLTCDITGAGRTILHGACSALHWFSFGNNSTRTPITLADDFSFSQHLGKGQLNIKVADISVKGLDSGEMKTLVIQQATFYAGENHFRFTGQGSLMFAEASVQANFIAKIHREKPEQQLFIVDPTWASKRGKSSVSGVWFVDGTTETAAELLMDYSFRKYTDWTGVGIASNGGVIPATGDQYVSLSHDGSDTTVPATLAAAGTNAVKLLTQQGLRDATIAFSEGQVLVSPTIIADSEAGNLTVGEPGAVGVGLVSYAAAQPSFKAKDITKKLIFNTTVETTAGANPKLYGPGEIVFNGPVVGTGGLTLEGGTTTDLIVRLAGDNTYQGQLYPWKGRVIIDSEHAIPDGSTLQIGDLGVVDLNGYWPDFSKFTVKIQGKGHMVIGSQGYVFAARSGRKDYSAAPLKPVAGDKVTITDAAEVAVTPRGRYVLATFKDPIEILPTLAEETAATLGPEWSLLAEGNLLVLRGPKFGMAVMVR